MSERMNILLNASYAYREQVLTTLKSLCYHNKSFDVFLVNNDYPLEWFDSIRKRLALLDCNITNIMMQTNFSGYKNPSHIQSSASYYRFYAGEAIQGEHARKALYLDCDVIVNGDLRKFYHHIDLKDNLAACAPDLGMVSLRKELTLDLYQQPYFNAGVMLLNIQAWRREMITQKLIHVANQCVHSLEFGAQDIFNIVFKNRWQKLKPFCNYQVAHQPVLNEDQEPLILHYTGAFKPWLLNDVQAHRQTYWSYYNLDWAQIYLQHNLVGAS